MFKQHDQVTIGMLATLRGKVEIAGLSGRVISISGDRVTVFVIGKGTITVNYADILCTTCSECGKLFYGQSPRFSGMSTENLCISCYDALLEDEAKFASNH